MKKKKLILCICSFSLLFGIAEVGSRVFLGLGDPPLFISDPKIEYLYKPSSTYKRFGHLVSFNRYSMRSQEFEPRKRAKNEFRVMVIGDSVVNGGAQIDQKDLATTLLQRELSAKLKRPVVVGNISAGSWGPPNELAYVQRFGFFDADEVVIVLSSHDYTDVPTFNPIVGVDRDFPDHKPPLALQEVLTRYLPRFLGLQKSSDSSISNANDDPKNSAISMSALRKLVQLARQSGADVSIAQHLEKEEISGAFHPEHEKILKEAHLLHVPVSQIGAEFRKAMSAGKDPYRDVIHTNALGQQLIEKSLLALVLQSLKSQRQ